MRSANDVISRSWDSTQIEKIDDRAFREQAIKSFHWHDSQRRYEIHFTDLVNCLLCSLKRKVLPNGNDDVDENYGEILTFVRGLGFDNLITGRFAGKRRVWIDSAQGDIDMMFQGIPYELTSSIYLRKALKERGDFEGRYQYKVEQLKMYMAALPSTTGRLKIIEVAGRPPTEHTFELHLRPLDLARQRIVLINRKDALLRALATGNLLGLKKLRDIYTPILKSSRCLDKQTGYCKEWSHLTGFEQARRDWLSEIARQYERNSPIMNDLRSLS